MLLESFLDIDIRDHNGRVLLECTCPTCAFFFLFFFFCNAVVLSIFCVLDFSTLKSSSHQPHY